MVRLRIREQFLKASWPMDLREMGRGGWRRAVHSSNAEAPMASRFAGRIMEIRLVQRVKHLWGISVRLSGRMMSGSEVQLAKAPGPKEVILEGREMD